MKENILERNARLHVDEKIAAFRVKQQQPYEFKVAYAQARAWEFYNECGKRGLNCHVSVGGLDSITLLLFLREIGIDVPAISVSMLEDKSIIAVHKQLGVERLHPCKKKTDIIREFGFPVLSKETAAKIELIQNPSDKNATVRHAIITGETGEYGGNRTGTRMQLSDRWLRLFGGADPEGAALGYKDAPFKVSSKCCYYLKEKPCDDWAKEHNSVPYLGLMASEGGRREKARRQRQNRQGGRKEKIMDDLEKVIKGLECCIKSISECQCADGCPYEDNCWGQNSEADDGDPMYLDLMRDALTLLKSQQERIAELEAKQEPRVMTSEEVQRAEEGTVVWFEQHTPERDYLQPMVSTGDRCVGNIYLGVNAQYVKDGAREYRFWTSRPTDEQRKAVKWEP